MTNEPITPASLRKKKISTEDTSEKRKIQS